jgi:hypothetical protein
MRDMVVYIIVNQVIRSLTCLWARHPLRTSYPDNGERPTVLASCKTGCFNHRLSQKATGKMVGGKILRESILPDTEDLSEVSTWKIGTESFLRRSRFPLEKKFFLRATETRTPNNTISSFYLFCNNYLSLICPYRRISNGYSIVNKNISYRNIINTVSLFNLISYYYILINYSAIENILNSHKAISLLPIYSDYKNIISATVTDIVISIATRLKVKPALYVSKQMDKSKAYVV